MRIHFWNTVFTLFFVLVATLGFGWLFAIDRVFYDIPTRDLVLLSLAIFRLVRLFTYDVITQFIRDGLAGGKPDTLRHTLGALLGCPWCTGLWFSFVVVFAYFATVFSWPFILVLALGAVASLLQILANAIGWTAERRKLEAKELQKRA